MGGLSHSSSLVHFEFYIDPEHSELWAIDRTFRADRDDKLKRSEDLTGSMLPLGFAMFDQSSTLFNLYFRQNMYLQQEVEY